ncbi:hypothetical protein [Aliikangiella sp. IMCC44359]|uniref:hypothetical protein n=1 Tax=Aliikangiella sp. IMCC44359 TaxID=3459125 RepID=UPI00403AED00
MKLSVFLLIFSLSRVISAEEEWSDTEWDDDWGSEQPIQVSHKISYAYAHLLDKNSINKENSVLNELRAVTKINYDASHFTVNSKLEINLDPLIDKYQLNLYELSVLLPLANSYDVKMGRQVITWGTGDLLFLNDLFPKDWKSFFNGRSDNYLKPPVDSVRVSHYGESINFEFALMPEFEADNSLSGERYSFYLNQQIIQPETELKFIDNHNSELAGRLFANTDGVEWALYFYSGYFKSPSKLTSDGLAYSKMHSIGASMRLPLMNGLFNIETAYYHSDEDNSGNDPWVNNSQIRLLVGYERELASELTLATQFFLEKTLDYQKLRENVLAGQDLPHKNRSIMTWRLTDLSLQQKLVNSLMLFYSPTDKDYYLRYSSRYQYNDGLSLTAGINWLDGRNENSFFAQLQDNSNMFMRFELNFE